MKKQVTKIIRNSVKCKKCGDEPVSTHVHDFKYCKCRNIAVDGGNEYLRRVGHAITDKSYEDTSITEEQEDIPIIKE